VGHVFLTLGRDQDPFEGPATPKAPGSPKEQN